MISGLARLGRAPALFALVVVVNALVQALLVWPDPIPAWSVSFIVLTALSALVAIKALTIVTTVALRTGEGKVGVRAGLVASYERFRAVSLWAVLLLVALAIGLALYVVPGILVLVLTPFVLLAAADGQAGPLGANFSAIRRHPWRWIIFVIVMGAIIAVSWLLGAVGVFFLGPVVAALITWIWFGFLAVWFQCSWAATYQRPGKAQQASA